MKIKLSKSQWEKIGKKAGWTKTAMKTIPNVGTISLLVLEKNDARPGNQTGTLENAEQQLLRTSQIEVTLAGGSTLTIIPSEGAASVFNDINILMQELIKINQTKI